MIGLQRDLYVEKILGHCSAGGQKYARFEQSGRRPCPPPGREPGLALARTEPGLRTFNESLVLSGSGNRYVGTVHTRIRICTYIGTSVR